MLPFPSILRDLRQNDTPKLQALSYASYDSEELIIFRTGC